MSLFSFQVDKKKICVQKHIEKAHSISPILFRLCNPGPTLEKQMCPQFCLTKNNNNNKINHLKNNTVMD